MDAWHAAWERVVAGVCTESAFTHDILARNANVHPASSTARALWSSHAPDLLCGWEHAGYDALLFRGADADADADGACSVRVTHGARFVGAAEGWTEVVALTTDFALPSRHVERAAQFVAVSSETVRALVARGVRLGATLARNARLRCADLQIFLGAVEWDALALATNAALAPRDLLSYLGAHAKEELEVPAGFYQELSMHPKLRVEDVLAFRSEPWCWYSISRSPSVTTPETYAKHKHELPFHLSGLLANPRFDDDGDDGDDGRRSRRSRRSHGVCVDHGYACTYCTTLAATQGDYGLDALDLALVNWEIFLRLSENPAEALDVARAAGVFDSEPGATNAYCALLGNPAATLAHVAECLERVRASGQMTTWVRVTAAANDLRVARDAYLERAETEREARARAAPAVVQLMRAWGVPNYFMPRLLPVLDTVEVDGA
jgi:hypothetical protein